MLTGKQVVALSELLHACRPDWDVRGIQAAIRRIEASWAWPAVCISAITAASNAANVTPDAIAWRKPSGSSQPVDHGQPCPTHNGTIRRPDGTWHCCWLADKTPPEPYRHAPHPPPEGLRERIAAGIAARREPATPEDAMPIDLSTEATRGGAPGLETHEARS